jgi:hypothetical protein
VEQWSVREDDRPLVRPQRRAELWLPALVIGVVIAAAAAYYVLQSRGDLAFDLPSPTPPGAAAPVAAQPAPPPAPEPAIRHPIDTALQPPAPSLPTLDNSDSMMRDSVAGLIGRKAFNESVIPAQLVRRIVATVDNLPRPTAARRMMPLQPVRGSFAAAPGDTPSIDARNFVRYTPYVRVLESVDARAMVHKYVRAYPLFQRAYEELGYPGKYFNDRQLDGPITLVQPKVVWQFADPDLEGRSAGQKMLMRMGKDNERRVKAKLREIRRELVAASRQD